MRAQRLYLTEKAQASDHCLLKPETAKEIFGKVGIDPEEAFDAFLARKDWDKHHCSDAFAHDLPEHRPC